MSDWNLSSPGRLAVLAVAIGILGWGAYDQLFARGPGPAIDAIRAADPTIDRRAIHLENMGRFEDRNSYRGYRHRLWCGTVDGRADGTVAAVVRHSRKGYSATVGYLALGWAADQDDNERWLLDECRRLKPQARPL